MAANRRGQFYMLFLQQVLQYCNSTLAVPHEMYTYGLVYCRILTFLSKLEILCNKFL